MPVGCISKASWRSGGNRPIAPGGRGSGSSSNKSDTFPIIAFVEKLGARPGRIASLYVGKREGGKLLYAGKARSGYTERVARELRERLDPLIRRTTPLTVPVKKPKYGRSRN